MSLVKNSLVLFFTFLTLFLFSQDTTMIFSHHDNAEIMAFDLSEDGKTIVTFSKLINENIEDNYISICDSENGFIIKQINLTDKLGKSVGNCVDVVLSNDAKEISTLFDSGDFYFGNLDSVNSLKHSKLEKHDKGNACFSENLDFISVFTNTIKSTETTQNTDFSIAKTSTGTLYNIDRKTGQIINKFSGNDWNTHVYDFIPQKNSILIAKNDHLTLRNIQNGQDSLSYSRDSIRFLFVKYIDQLDVALTLTRITQEHESYDSLEIIDLKNGKLIAQEAYIDKWAKLDFFACEYNPKKNLLFLYPNKKCDGFPVVVFELKKGKKTKAQLKGPLYEFHFDLLETNAPVVINPLNNRLITIGKIPSSTQKGKDILAIYDDLGSRLYPKIDYAQDNTFYLFETIHEDFLFEIEQLFTENLFEEYMVKLNPETKISVFCDYEWFANSSNGFFSGSSTAIRNSGYWVNGKVFECEQFFLHLYRPEKLFSPTDSIGTLHSQLKDIRAKHLKTFGFDSLNLFSWNAPDIDVLKVTEMPYFAKAGEKKYSVELRLSDKNHNLKRLYYMVVSTSERELKQIELSDKKSKDVKQKLSLDNVGWGSKIEFYLLNEQGVFSNKKVIVVK